MWKGEKEMDGGEKRIREQRKTWTVVGFGSCGSQDSMVLLHLEMCVAENY